MDLKINDKKASFVRSAQNKKPPQCGGLSFFYLLFAERVGFEPTVQCNPYDDLANRSFRPLRHLSKQAKIMGAKNTDIRPIIGKKTNSKSLTEFGTL